MESDAVNRVLTLEIKQKRNEALLANMSAMPLVPVGIFDALFLTDTQKRQMEKIQEELRPEFDTTLEKYTNGQMVLVNKVLHELEKRGESQSPEDGGEAIRKTLESDDPDYKKTYEECKSLGRLFAERFKVKILDVLTDEQWIRLQDLIDNPQEHAKVAHEIIIQSWRKRNAWDTDVTLWMSSDAIPDEYRQRRNLR
jgi:hypothetical protein